MESFKKGIKKLSLENKELLYKVRCTNYIDNRRYYVQNGKWARAESFNTKYAFSQDKVHFSKLPKDAIYKATVIENNSQNRNLYNL